MGKGPQPPGLPCSLTKSLKSPGALCETKLLKHTRVNAKLPTKNIPGCCSPFKEGIKSPVLKEVSC